MLKALKKKLIQKLLYSKVKKHNNIKKNVLLSKDTIIGKGCFIGNNVIFSANVKLNDKVHIGNDVLLSNIQILENSFIESGVICTGFGNGTIKIGKHSYIGIRNILDWSDNITIGDFVHIAGPSTGLWTHSSAKMCLNGIPLENKDKKYRPTAPIVIENNVYIGGNCTIYPGIKIGHHSIIAPNSAVTQDVPPYSLFGGVPAKFIKKIEI